MLEVIGSSLIGLLLEFFTRQPPNLETVPVLAWQDAAIFNLPTEPDPRAETIVDRYLQDLSRRGFASSRQGVWIQSDLAQLAQHRGNVPISAASITKIATSLAALEKWGSQHRFETQVLAAGRLNQGTLEGDLVIIGGSDPFFVWEEAFALGNTLNQLGIRRVTGNLVISGDFAMNYNSNALTAGRLLRQALDRSSWSSQALRQYRTLPQGTPRPEIKIAGSVVLKQAPQSSQLLVRHQSMSLAEILRQMNIYSNNKMSEMLARNVGGAAVVAQRAAQAAKVPRDEIKLVNGSGLGINNRISPRAACAMLLAIERHLLDQPLGVADLFPVSGRDSLGTMLNRRIPNYTTVKTGTLAEVSALAGVIPTRDRGLVWFAIINGGGDIEGLRAQQDILLQRLVQEWGTLPIDLATNGEWLGDPQRSIAVTDNRG